MPKAKAGTGAKPQVSPPERYPSGDPKPKDDAADGFAPTLIKRLKDDLIPKAKDRRLGSVLGLLHLEGVLTEIETEAGFRLAGDIGAYERIKGHPPRHSQSQGFEFGRKGADGLDLEALRRMDPETAERIEKSIKRKRKAIQKRYDRAQMYIPHHPILISTVVEEVCCNDQRVNPLHHPMLKTVLRNLAERCYGLVQVGDEQAKSRKPMSRKTDAVLLAQGTVDAIADWFSRRAGTVTSFRLAAPHPRAPIAITAYGHTALGEVIEHTIKLKRSGLMAEAINAQLLKAAEEKGWPEAKIERENAA